MSSRQVRVNSTGKPFRRGPSIRYIHMYVSISMYICVYRCTRIRIYAHRYTYTYAERGFMIAGYCPRSKSQ